MADRKQRLRYVVGILLAAAMVSGVGGCLAETSVEEVDPSAQEPPDRDGIVEGRLGFVDVTGDEIREVVAAYGGEIEIAPEGLRMVQVRFPVDDVEALLEIRDELRAEGYRVDVVPATDPGTDGGVESFLDVEP